MSQDPETKSSDNLLKCRQDGVEEKRAACQVKIKLPETQECGKMEKRIREDPKH